MFTKYNDLKMKSKTFTFFFTKDNLLKTKLIAFLTNTESAIILTGRQFFATLLKKIYFYILLFYENTIDFKST